MTDAWRVPVDEAYVALVGRATYVFAYYEWSIIYIIEQLSPGFLTEYARGGKPMTSGAVLKRLKSGIDALESNIGDVTVRDLRTVQNEFDLLISRRNALIHAHPATEDAGSQILIHQKSNPNALLDMKWPMDTVRQLISDFDAAAVRASPVLHELIETRKSASA